MGWITEWVETACLSEGNIVTEVGPREWSCRLYGRETTKVHTVDFNPVF